jgi:hypothetical protein
MKNKTLLEAATDMLLNKTESVVAEAVPSINWENLTTTELFDIVTKAGLALRDYIPSHHYPTKGYWKHFNDAREDLMGQFKKIGIYKESSDEGESEENELEEATEVDNIAAKVAELKVGDMTNFGKVMAKSNNSISFKAKDLPVTKITFNQRKMGSRDYVLSALRMIK